MTATEASTRTGFATATAALKDALIEAIREDAVLPGGGGLNLLSTIVETRAEADRCGIGRPEAIANEWQMVLSIAVEKILDAAAAKSPNALQSSARSLHTIVEYTARYLADGDGQ